MIAFILFELSISEKKKIQNVGNRFSDLIKFLLHRHQRETKMHSL